MTDNNGAVLAGIIHSFVSLLSEQANILREKAKLANEQGQVDFNSGEAVAVASSLDLSAQLIRDFYEGAQMVEDELEKIRKLHP